MTFIEVVMKNRRREINILLDTNVWRYISDRGAGKDLLKKAIKHDLNILIAPSVLYEALRTNNPELRDRLVALMTQPQWKRLMPEAFVTCQELIWEVRRLRPQWLRKNPNRQWTTRLRIDWRRKKGGFWDRARYSTESEANALELMEEGLVDLARIKTKEYQENLRKDKWSYGKIQLDKMVVRFPNPLIGWKGDDVEPWRVTGMLEVKESLAGLRQHPYKDWLSSEIDIPLIMGSVRSWHEFWLYEIAAKYMPTFWLRWAIEMLQSMRKITAGTPCDSQLGAYLHRCDYFISADKTFIQIINDCIKFSPIDTCEAKLIPGGEDAISELFDVISNLDTKGK